MRYSTETSTDDAGKHACARTDAVTLARMQVLALSNAVLEVPEESSQRERQNQGQFLVRVTADGKTHTVCAMRERLCENQTLSITLQGGEKYTFSCYSGLGKKKSGKQPVIAHLIGSLHILKDLDEDDDDSSDPEVVCPLVL